MWKYADFREWLNSFTTSRLIDEGTTILLNSSLDEDWLAESPQVNAFLIYGNEGKTSLVYHMADVCGYKVIEVNNSDQEISNIVNCLQEATQSHLIRTQGDKVRSEKANKQTHNNSSVVFLESYGM